MNMRALLKRETGVRLEQIPVPAFTRPDDVRIRVAFAGICRTDLYVADGRRRARSDIVLGHELAGLVDEAARGVDLAPGTPVTVVPELACRACRRCGRGEECSRPRMLGLDHDGAFADHVLVPAEAVIRLPPGLSLARAAYVEPVAAALAVLDAPGVTGGRSGILLGKNRIAELVRRVCALRGVELAQVGAEPEEARQAHAHQGAFDFVVETLATPDTLALALELVRPGGVVVLKSRPDAPVALDIARAVQKRISLCAVNYGSFHEAVRLLASGELSIDDVLAEPVRLEAWSRAFQDAREPGAKKILFTLEA